MNPIQTEADGFHAWLDRDFIEEHIYSSEVLDSLIWQEHILEGDDGRFMVDLNSLEIYTPGDHDVTMWLDTDSAIERLGIDSADFAKMALSPEMLCRVGEDGEIEYLVDYIDEQVAA
ncbi:MAG: hypothetical protein Phyf2KO_00610 [Phycisphaerales bacterium]